MTIRKMKTLADFNRINLLEMLARHRSNMKSGRRLSEKRFEDIFFLLRRMVSLHFKGTNLDDRKIRKGKVHAIIAKNLNSKAAGYLVIVSNENKKRIGLVYMFNLLYARSGFEAIASIIHEMTHLEYQSHGVRFFGLMGKIGSKILNVSRLDFLNAVDTIQDYPCLDEAIKREEVWIENQTRKLCTVQGIDYEDPHKAKS